MPEVKFISNPEIDRLMEDEIVKSGLWPASPSEHFDVETFLEKHLGCGLDKDASLPEDVMGEVIFRPGKRTCVKINAGLTYDMENPEAAWQVGRWRMTVAHESAHVILHGPLYLNQGAQDDLWEQQFGQVHRCYKKADKRFESSDFVREANDFASRYGWSSGCLLNDTAARQRMEFQANRGAAALLMPASSYLSSARELFSYLSEKEPNLSEESRINWVVARLAENFGVSREAARIRCGDLNATQYASQLALF